MKKIFIASVMLLIMVNVFPETVIKPASFVEDLNKVNSDGCVITSIISCENKEEVEELLQIDHLERYLVMIYPCISTYSRFIYDVLFIYEDGIMRCIVKHDLGENKSACYQIY